MKKTIILILVLISAGCLSTKLIVEPITSQDLNKLKCEWQDPKVSQWFYLGPERGYHIFVHRDSPADKYYKVPGYKIDKQEILPNDESQWILMPWGPEYDECKK